MALQVGVNIELIDTDDGLPTIRVLRAETIAPVAGPDGEIDPSGVIAQGTSIVDRLVADAHEQARAQFSNMEGSFAAMFNNGVIGADDD